MQVQPYLMFEGRCDEAIEFYRSALGAEVSMLMRFKEAPAGDQGMVTPGSGDKVMHAALRIGGSTVLLSDGRCSGRTDFGGIALSLAVDGDAEAARAFQALGDGGQVFMPLAETFFASRFGVVADRFGVMWMVIFER